MTDTDTGYIPEDPSTWTPMNVADLEYWVEHNAPQNVRFGLLGLLGTVDTTARYSILKGGTVEPGEASVPASVKSR